jgi:hypothetical protein
MNTPTVRKAGLALAAAAASAAVAIGVPLAMAAPTAVPPSDTGGYLDSTAHCAAPDIAVLFGTTKTSRIAICKTAAGAYEYRGVRVSDGAKLVTAADQTSADTYVVSNDGVKYTVTPTALSVTSNGDTFRTETWTDFHSTQSPAGSTAGSATTKPSTSSTSTPSTSGAPTSKASTSAAPSTSSAASPSATSAPKSSAAPSSAVPLPPPLAAEVGGGSSGG